MINLLLASLCMSCSQTLTVTVSIFTKILQLLPGASHPFRLISELSGFWMHNLYIWKLKIENVIGISYTFWGINFSMHEFPVVYDLLTSLEVCIHNYHFLATDLFYSWKILEKYFSSNFHYGNLLDIYLI